MEQEQMEVLIWAIQRIHSDVLRQQRMEKQYRDNHRYGLADSQKAVTDDLNDKIDSLIELLPEEKREEIMLATDRLTIRQPQGQGLKDSLVELIEKSGDEGAEALSRLLETNEISLDMSDEASRREHIEAAVEALVVKKEKASRESEEPSEKRSTTQIIDDLFLAFSEVARHAGVDLDHEEDATDEQKENEGLIDALGEYCESLGLENADLKPFTQHTLLSDPLPTLRETITALFMVLEMDPARVRKGIEACHTAKEAAPDHMKAMQDENPATPDEATETPDPQSPETVSVARPETPVEKEDEPSDSQGTVVPDEVPSDHTITDSAENEAERLGVNIEEIQGTGLNGRILIGDVRKHHEAILASQVTNTTDENNPTETPDEPETPAPDAEGEGDDMTPAEDEKQ